MVIREWRGRASRSRKAASPAHFHAAVMPDPRGTAGFLGAPLSQRLIGDIVEFLVLARWDSMEAVRGFAGPDACRAVVEPGAVAALLGFDATVQHYDVIEDVGLVNNACTVGRKLINDTRQIQLCNLAQRPDCTRWR